ncbi:putative ankyrin repeat protein RF_0381 [Leptopilina heterotoma]|uniref:putative ankyrin repeat protein RF_0381 n=1 Tax=Leptopilina heterotoma TaxID=63436 RepID=UPI001CA7FC89|nr:putative ankyrin repeat protein RF_0381 [Leptopilina heterotoma]XP_043472535.1 putative ankyrin repeat protein RF_0381 [Leptopilina heterotoma]
MDSSSNDYNDTSDYNELFLAVHNGELHRAFSLFDRYSITETIRGKSLLHVAIARGHSEIAKMFILKRDRYGNTPLHLAIREDQPELFNLLLKESHLLNARNFGNKSPLHFAASYDYPEFAKPLLDNGATVEVKDKEGNTPLYVALANESLQVAEVLFEHGAVLSDNDLTNMESLRNAVWRGNLELVQLLMVNGCSRVDIPKIGNSALILAATSGRLDILECLMKKGEKSSETINKDELHLFKTSIENYRSNILKYLVDIGVKTETVDDIFYDVINLKRYDMWEYLVKLLSTIYAKAHCKEKQLHFSVRAGQPEVVKAIVNEPTNEYESDPFAKKLAVYIAVETGNEEILETLLNAGYPVDSLFKVITPLHVAATLEHPRLVKLLLKAGADVNLQTEHGLTPLHFAATLAQPAVVKFLLENGADPSKTCNFKGSPLSMSLNMFSEIFRGRNITTSTFEKLVKITKMLIPHLKSEECKGLFHYAIKIRVLTSNEKNDSNLLLHYNHFEFRPEIVRCICAYLSDEDIKLCSNRFLNIIHSLKPTPALLQLLMEYDDSTSCFDIEIDNFYVSDKSKFLLIGYSKNVNDLLNIKAENFSSHYNDEDNKRERTNCFKLIVARLILLTEDCHPGVLEFCQKNNLTDWRIECIRQRDIMQKTKIDIDLNVTFYDALTRPVNKLAMYANNKNFVKTVDYSQAEFPAYAEFIKANVELAETRRTFITECVCLMFSVIKQNHKIQISNADIYQIFQYLSVVDLRRFSTACS